MRKFVTIICLACCTSVTAQKIQVKKICDLDKKFYETSGLVFLHNKYLITHNDGGNKSEIYLLDTNGRHLLTIDVDEAKNQDWEDIALDDKGRLYIGDIGNNYNNRKKLQIYILRSGFEFDKNRKVNADKITFTYEDQKSFPPDKNNMNFDAEALIWKDDKIYIFTKCRSKPFTGVSNVYVIPAEPGQYIAKKIGAFQFCSSAWQFCGVTAADYNPSTKELLVMTYSRMHIYSDFPNHEFWKGKHSVFSLPGIKQREAICYASKNSWFMTDEYKYGFGGGNLYKVSLK